MHTSSPDHTTAGTGAHSRRSAHGGNAWARLHWRERAALVEVEVSRAEWEHLPETVRADLLVSVPAAYPAGEDGSRTWERAGLRPVRDSLPPDHPRRVRERRDGLLIEARTAAESAEAAAGTGYVDSRWFFDGEPEPTPEAENGATAHAEAVHQASLDRMRYAESVHALAVLILAAVAELLEVREATPRTGPQHSGPAPPEPPPQQVALTRSTLTAAPPAAAMPVPYTRCVVTLAA